MSVQLKKNVMICFFHYRCQYQLKRDEMSCFLHPECQYHRLLYKWTMHGKSPSITTHPQHQTKLK